MWRSNEQGRPPTDGMYERERLRRMARKLGLHLVKFGDGDAAGRRGDAADQSGTEQKKRSSEPAYSVDEQAS